jgi:hypothetical protein
VLWISVIYSTKTIFIGEKNNESSFKTKPQAMANVQEKVK